jgi:hypothetical protein
MYISAWDMPDALRALDLESRAAAIVRRLSSSISFASIFHAKAVTTPGVSSPRLHITIAKPRPA